MAKTRRGLDGRHRDKSGRIEKKHGNTRIGTLRKEYGPSFADGPAQGHDAQDLAQGDRVGVVARLSAASSQITPRQRLRLRAGADFRRRGAIDATAAGLSRRSAKLVGTRHRPSRAESLIAGVGEQIARPQRRVQIGEAQHLMRRDAP